MAKLVQYSGKASLRLNQGKITRNTHVEKKALMARLAKKAQPPQPKKT